MLGIFMLYFQFLIADKFAVWKFIPNFLLAYVIYSTIRTGLKPTLSIAFFLGLAFDLLNPVLLGINSLCFVIISFITGNFHESVNKRRFTVVVISILLLNTVYFLIQSFYYFLNRQSEADFFIRFLFMICYNSFITTISVYFLIVCSKIKLVLNV